jgi:hypothetical protein
MLLCTCGHVRVPLLDELELDELAVEDALDDDELAVDEVLDVDDVLDVDTPEELEVDDALADEAVVDAEELVDDVAPPPPLELLEAPDVTVIAEVVGPGPLGSPPRPVAVVTDVPPCPDDVREPPPGPSPFTRSGP